jgi:hypothetical protein
MSVAIYRDKTMVVCESCCCVASFDAGKKYPSRARAAAGEAGWSVRPLSGPGARSAPDLCPTHKPKESS